MSAREFGLGRMRTIRLLSHLFGSRVAVTTARAVARTVRDFERNDYLTSAAALAFYFFLAMFPLLTFIGAALGFVSVSHLFNQILDLLAIVVPPDAMRVIRGVLQDAARNPAGLISIGIGGAVLASSSGFSAMITVLNIAYDVPESRPFLKKWLLSVGMTLLTGIITILALAAIALGPSFGAWLTTYLKLGGSFAAAWPFLRWLLITLSTVLSVEVIYFVGPNVKQRFLAQIPGAALAVVSWVMASWGLSWYLRSFAHYNLSFGALGAVVALMLWLYVSALAIILGAELNSELMKSRVEGLDPRRLTELQMGRTAQKSS